MTDNSLKYYTGDDIKRAFDMGLETALIVIEKSIGLSEDGQRKLLLKLKEKIEEDSDQHQIVKRSV